MVQLPTSELERLRKSRPWFIGGYGLLLAGLLYWGSRGPDTLQPLQVAGAITALALTVELLSFPLLKRRGDIIYTARLCLLSALAATSVSLGGGLWPLVALSLAPILALTLALGPGSGTLAAALAMVVLILTQSDHPSESVASSLVLGLGIGLGVFLERYFQITAPAQTDFSDLIGFENVTEGVIVTDTAARVYYLNPAAAVQIRWDRDEATGLPLTTLLPLDSDTSQPLDTRLQAALESGRPQTLRGKLISRVAPGRTLDISISPLPEGRGTVVLLRDVTDEVGQDSDRLEFASTVSHELRTPLATAAGYLELLKNSEGLSPKASEQVTQAYDAVGRMSRLLQRFLRTAQIGQDKVKAVVVRPFRIEPQIDEVIAELGNEAEKKGLSLTRRRPGEVERVAPEVLGDVDRVREILENLIGNAIKFTEKGGVEVSLEQGAGQLRVHVRDSGIGISPEDQSRIFDRYYRAETDFTQAHGGTGLGLYISRGLATSMGGSLGVTSTLGAGSTFTLTLPLARGTT